MHPDAESMHAARINTTILRSLRVVYVVYVGDGKEKKSAVVLFPHARILRRLDYLQTRALSSSCCVVL